MSQTPYPHCLNTLNVSGFILTWTNQTNPCKENRKMPWWNFSNKENRLRCVIFKMNNEGNCLSCCSASVNVSDTFYLKCPQYVLICFGWMIMKHLRCASGREPFCGRFSLSSKGENVLFKTKCDFLMKCNKLLQLCFWCLANTWG